jgi:putative restriction endonuclease
VLLVSAQQGIFKPAVLPEMPLSITTVPIVEGRPRPYEDGVGPDGLLLYRYRGRDPSHRDNRGLRLAMERQAPLIYFYGIVPGEYLAIWPVFIVGDDPATLTFTVAVDAPEGAGREAAQSAVSEDAFSEAVIARRVYVTREVRARMHQAGFRLRVIRAYRERCAVCRLRHEELLDAAHILPDVHPRGEPVIPNGLALCKLHHAAFDCHFLGVRPDYRIEIREDLLAEPDGPMLQHGLREFHRKELLVLPRHEELRPNRDFLAERYELFRRAG